MKAQAASAWNIQIASLAAHIDLATVERATGRTGQKKIHELAKLVIAKDLKGSLEFVSLLSDEGYNLVQFAKDLIHYFRKVLSLKVNPALSKVFEKELTRDEIAAILKLSAAADVASLVKLIRALIRAYAEMRYSPFAIVPLEVVLVEHLS